MKYILKKIAYATLVLWGVVTLVFFLFIGFGDPAQMMLGQSGDKATLDNVRKELHLDKPVWKQYLYYINDISPVCTHSTTEIETKGLSGVFVGGKTKVGIKWPHLRKSYQSKKAVGALIMEALPGTAVLALAAILFAFSLGIMLGLLCVVHPNGRLDNWIQGCVLLGISLPSFFIAILMACIFGLLLHEYTGLNLTGSLFEVDEVTGKKFMNIKNLILPAVTLGIRPLAIITQLTRSCLLEELHKDYIRTAKAKGLSRKKILMRHALPNALNPVVTAVTGWFAEMLAGAFFIEYIFGWKGIGKLTVEALERLDYPVVMGTVLFTALVFIFMNILTEFLYVSLDPRIKNG